MNLSFENLSIHGVQTDVVEEQDIGVIKDLWILLEKYHDALDKESDPTEDYDAAFIRWVKDHVLSASSKLFVAKTPNSIIGYCLAVVYHPDQHRFQPQGVISSMYVDETYRRFNLGSRLLSASLAWLKQHVKQKKDITLTVMIGNEHVLEFYAANGLQLRGYLMSLE